MPFQKVSGGKFKSPSGKSYTKKQVALYYAGNGFPATGAAKPAAKKRPKKRKAKK